MEIILRLLINIKENKKNVYFFIFILILLLITLTLIVFFTMDIDPFIYFQFWKINIENHDKENNKFYFFDYICIYFFKCDSRIHMAVYNWL